MASIEEVKGWIRDGIYPHVARTSDPLIVRVSRFSLLVNDTNFYAKIKNGLGYKGYLIYSSGLGTPILEESATNEAEFFRNDAFKKAISDNGTLIGDKFYESAESVLMVLQDAAQSWLDTIELEIAKQPNDNAIKKAIDRLCWQLHYDITESHTDFATLFKDNDFANVQIDRYPMETEYWDGITLTTAISDSAGVTYKKDYGTDKCTVTIKDKGYLKDFDDHLTTGTYKTEVEDDKTVVTKGSLMTVFDEHLLGGMYKDESNQIIGAIKTFDEHLLKDSYEGDQFAVTTGAFEMFNKALNGTDTGKEGSLIKIGTKLVPDDTVTKKYYSISECLRDKDDYNDDDKKTFSIARSLREGKSQTSVSQATHDQTELEATRFTKIDNNIGDCNINSDPNTEPVYLPLSERIGKTGDTILSNVSVADRIGDTGEVSIEERIGNFSVSDSGGTFKSLFDTISGANGYANPNTHSLYQAVGYGSGTGLEGRLGVTHTNPRSIAERLGYNSSGTVEGIKGDTQFIYNLMKPSRYGGTGFVNYDGSGDEQHFYVRTSSW